MQGYTNPSPYLITSPIGIDREVQKIQAKIQALSWMQACFGRAFKQESLFDTDKVRYERRHFYPEVYLEGYEPMNALPNDNMRSSAFFYTKDPAILHGDYMHFNQPNAWTYRTSLTVWANMSLVAGDFDLPANVDWRFAEYLKRDVLRVLSNCSNVKVVEIFDSWLGVLEEWTINDNYKHCTRPPYCAFRIEMDITFVEKKAECEAVVVVTEPETGLPDNADNFRVIGWQNNYSNSWLYDVIDEFQNGVANYPVEIIDGLYKTNLGSGYYSAIETLGEGYFFYAYNTSDGFIYRMSNGTDLVVTRVLSPFMNIKWIDGIERDVVDITTANVPSEFGITKLVIDTDGLLNVLVPDGTIVSLLETNGWYFVQDTDDNVFGIRIENGVFVTAIPLDAGEYTIGTEENLNILFDGILPGLTYDTVNHDTISATRIDVAFTVQVKINGIVIYENWTYPVNGEALFEYHLPHDSNATIEVLFND